MDGIVIILCTGIQVCTHGESDILLPNVFLTVDGMRPAPVALTSLPGWADPVLWNCELEKARSPLFCFCQNTLSLQQKKELPY